MSQAPNPSFKEEVERGFAMQSVMKLIGAKLGRVEPGIVEINLPFRADLGQQHGYLVISDLGMRISDLLSRRFSQIYADQNLLESRKRRIILICVYLQKSAAQ